MMQPLWIDGELVLARRVAFDGGDFIQGCWLDWSLLETMMLEGVKDLLPDAALERVVENEGVDRDRRLASLPVSLIPGPVPTDSLDARSPVVFSLGVAWVSVVLAACAVVVLLLGAMALSERRRGFVAAVTHEMRTPLTTFRLYTEMLSEGMVRDEAKRQSYLERLRIEADRLGHLVENVLAYAGLESGRTRRQVERVAVADVVARVEDRLSDRASQSEMELVVGVDDQAAESTLELDLSAVEQILLNLVDNACKYGGGEDDRRVHLDAKRVNGAVRFTVRDHGSGISKSGARRLFRPFSKSVDEAACSAPGVGLGLALSRRFAREMGGDLYLDKGVTDGAAFVLRLPTS
jgi:signal transduction histidine kinase